MSDPFVIDSSIGIGWVHPSQEMRGAVALRFGAMKARLCITR